jgi:GH18 family chitinase
MRRRNFVHLVVVALAVRPLSAFGQAAERVRRIGVLVSAPANDAEYPTLLNAFRERLEELGWSEGRNLLMTSAGAGAVKRTFTETRSSWSASRRT